MNAKLQIPPFLLHLTGNENEVITHGNTVGECLDDFTERYPGTWDLLFEHKGELQNHIGIVVNGNNVYPDELTRKISSGDEIYILSLITGG